jgi:F-type H+-transporting ATPase subunit beta
MDQQIVRRARRLDRFLTQPFFATESLTGLAGRHVPIEDTIAGCEAILSGKCDDVDERRLCMIGKIDEAIHGFTSQRSCP